MLRVLYHKKEEELIRIDTREKYSWSRIEKALEQNIPVNIIPVNDLDKFNKLRRE